MRRIAIALACAALLAGCADERPYALSDTQVVDFASRDKIHDFHLLVGLPRDYAKRTAERFPVVYLLDADYSFALARNELRHFNDRKQLQEAILVGIAYPDADADIGVYHRTRVRDYTPTQATSSGYDDAPDALSGHAPEFLKVLRDELLPDIDARYRTDPKARMLVGHSYGGLFATWTMLTEPGLFRDYLIVSPSYWYDDKTIFGAAARYAAAHQDLSANVFYGVGSLEGGGAMASDLQAFDAQMTAAKFPGYRSTVRVFEGETHNSIFPQRCRAGSALSTASPARTPPSPERAS